MAIGIGRPGYAPVRPCSGAPLGRDGVAWKSRNLFDVASWMMNAGSACGWGWAGIPTVPIGIEVGRLQIRYDRIFVVGVAQLHQKEVGARVAAAICCIGNAHAACYKVISQRASWGWIGTSWRFITEIEFPLVHISCSCINATV